MYAEKQPLSVLLVSGSAKITESFRDLLTGDMISSINFAINAGEAKRLLTSQQFDIVIVNTPLTDEFGSDFAIDVAENGYSGVLMLVKSDLFDQVSYAVEDYGILCVLKPSPKQSIYQAIKLIIATRSRLKKAENKTATMQAKMNEIRLVNRAKWLLIEQLKMTEPDAHRYIEKQAMDLRITRGEVAENILKTYQN